MTPAYDIIPAQASGHSKPAWGEVEFHSFQAVTLNSTVFNNDSLTVLDEGVDKTSTTKDFHRDMFVKQVKKADMRAVFTEYAWDKNWSDPCDANPLNPEELQSLGVFWLTETPPDFVPGREPRSIMPPMDGARDVMRYSWKTEDPSYSYMRAKFLDELTAAA